MTGRQVRTQVRGPLVALAPPAPVVYTSRRPEARALLASGHAVAGCASSRFWPLEENLGNKVAVADRFGETVGPPSGPWRGGTRSAG